MAGGFSSTEYGPYGGPLDAGIASFDESYPSNLFSTSCRSPPRRRRSAPSPWPMVSLHPREGTTGTYPHHPCP
ncbi:hypothetical protein JMJ77_0001944, partial [Colletotrichum scovillei]